MGTMSFERAGAGDRAAMVRRGRWTAPSHLDAVNRLSTCQVAELDPAVRSF